MRWWQRAALWTFILLVCAGIGAFVASRSNPFPPEVPVSPSSSPGGSTPPGQPPARWRLTIVSRTSHAYRVGGSCRSDWRMRAPIRVTADGDVSGGGVARLLPGAGCDFPTAQVQAESIEVRIAGRRSDERLELRFGRKDIRPPGSQDLGGFFRTLPAMRLSIRERDGATARDTTRVDDQAGEVHLATTSLRLSG